MRAATCRPPSTPPASNATSAKPALADPAGFRTGFALMAAQRHARIIGLFVRLLERDGKPDYLPHLPRVWRMFERALQHEALAPLRAWVDRLLPPPLRRIGALMIRTAMILAAGRGERMRPLTDVDAQAADPRRRPLDARTRDGSPAAARRAEHRGERASPRQPDRRPPAAAAPASSARTICWRPAAACRNALPLLGNAPFFVLNGDGLWRDGPDSMLGRLQAMWDPRRMDALLLLHPLATAIGREEKDRGDYYLEPDGHARHRGTRRDARPISSPASRSATSACSTARRKARSRC